MAATASASPAIGDSTPIGSPRLPSTASPEAAGPNGAGQRRTSWREWGTSLSSWASTKSSPFRAGPRPMSSSSGSFSTFGFGPTALGRSRADAVVLPPSEVTKQLAEASDEALLQEGERLRLPPTPAELEALEAAGVQDEEDLRLEAEERERIRSLPPPPRHHSVFGRLAGAMSTQSSPSPAPPASTDFSITNSASSTSQASPPQARDEDTRSPVLLPPIPLEKDAPEDQRQTPAASTESLAHTIASPAEVQTMGPVKAPVITPPPSATVPSLLVSSATAQSLVGQASSLPRSDSVLPSPSHSVPSEADPLSTPMTPDTRFGYDSGAYELPRRPVERNARREDSDASLYEGGTGSESESAKEDLIPADMYQDSEPENELPAGGGRSGSSTPEAVSDKRRSRSTKDRFSLLLSSLTRSEDTSVDVPDRAATPLAGNPAPKASSSAPDAAPGVGASDAGGSGNARVVVAKRAAHEDTASSASDYDESEGEDDRSVDALSTAAADDTVILNSAELVAGSETAQSQGGTVPGQAASSMPADQAIQEPVPRSVVFQDANENIGTPIAKVSEVQEEDEVARRISMASSHRSASEYSENEAGMKSLGQELMEAKHPQPKEAKEHQVATAPPSVESRDVSVQLNAVDEAVATSNTSSSIEGGQDSSSGPLPQDLSSIGTTEAEKQLEELPRSAESALEMLGAPAAEAARAAKEDASETTGLPASATTQTFVSFSQSFTSLPDGSDADRAGVLAREAKDEGVTLPSFAPGEHAASAMTASQEVKEANESDIVDGGLSQDTPSTLPETEEDGQGKAAAADDSHSRLQDALGLGRSGSPAPSITSASSFASAVSEENNQESAADSRKEYVDKGSEDKDSESAVHDAEVKIEDAQPLDTVEATPLIPQVVQSKPDDTEGDDAESSLVTGAVEAPKLGSPRVPNSPSLGEQSGSSSRRHSAELVSAEASAAPSASGHNESTPMSAVSRADGLAGETPAEGTTDTPDSSAAASASTSPNPARPTRSRNRKGPAPTPPAPTPVATLGAVAAAAAAAAASKRSSLASVESQIMARALTPVSVEEGAPASAGETPETAGAATSPAAPPSRPPRARPPRAQARAAAAPAPSPADAPGATGSASDGTGSAAAAPLPAGADTLAENGSAAVPSSPLAQIHALGSVAPETPAAADPAAGPVLSPADSEASLSGPKTTPGGTKKKKVQRKAVPRAA